MHALPSLRVAVAGEVRRIAFSETGAVVATDSVSGPTTTMALPFVVRVSPEGAMEMRIAG